MVYTTHYTGPLSWLDKNTDKVKVKAVVKSGDDDDIAEPNPGLYVDVSNQRILAWINKKTKSCNNGTCKKGNCMTMKKLEKETKKIFYK